MVRRAEEYAMRRGMALRKRLGFGNNGTVWSTSHRTALKIHRRLADYSRERDAYVRFAGAKQIAGHWIPKLIAFDNTLMAIEMTVVEAPFVLDFASAYPVHEAPDFPPEVMQDWLEEKREQFGEDWPKAAAVIRAMERDFGLRLLDVHPANIRSAPWSSGSA
jgi:hypothetical protein